MGRASCGGGGSAAGLHVNSHLLWKCSLGPKAWAVASPRPRPLVCLTGSLQPVSFCKLTQAVRAPTLPPGNAVPDPDPGAGRVRHSKASWRPWMSPKLGVPWSPQRRPHLCQRPGRELGGSGLRAWRLKGQRLRRAGREGGRGGQGPCHGGESRVTLGQPEAGREEASHSPRHPPVPLPASKAVKGDAGSTRCGPQLAGATWSLLLRAERRRMARPGLETPLHTQQDQAESPRAAGHGTRPPLLPG